MTGPNRFTFDVVANDKSSETVDKINSSVARLVPTLQAAAAAYAQMERSQSKLGRAAADAARQTERAAQTQARADERAERAAQRRAEAENRAAQTRANLVSRSMQQEARAQKQIEDLYSKSIALTQKDAAVRSQTVEQKIGLINREIARTQALIAIRAKEVETAQASARVAIQANRTGTGSSGTGAGDARASAAAVDALRTAHQRLAQAQAQNAAASNQLTAVQRQLNQAQQAGAVSLAANEAALNRARYALYQVGAAYGAAAKGALDAARATVGVAVEYEKSFSAVERTTGLGALIRENVGTASVQAAGQVAVLKNEFTQLSREIPLTFDKLTDIGSLGAQLGIGAQDITEFTTVVAKFAATTNVVAETAAQEFGRLGNLLDVPASKFVNLGSAVAQLGVDSVATEREILSVTSEIAAVGSNAGFSAPYVVGLGTALASLRISPYLARGAVGRILQTITRAAAEGGEAMDKYAQVLGTTSQAATQLFNDNPEQFFTQFIQGLGQASDNGQNLTLTLDDLGIKGSQNTRVVTALANSYQLLGKYTDDAASSFQKGTFLDESFAGTAELTATALDTMIASFKAFVSSVGSTFLPVVKGVADFLNGLFKMLAGFPGMLTGGVAALIAAVGVLFAYRSAVALGSAALLAFRAAGNNLGGGITRLTTIMNVLRQNQQAQTVAANQAAASFTREEVAVLGLSAAATRGAVPLGVLAAEQRAIAVASPAAAAGLGATAAAAAATGTAATGAAAGVRGFMSALGPVGWILLGLTTLGGVFLGLKADLDESATAAEEARQAQARLNSEWQASGSGAESLQKAIAADSKAFESAGRAATDANGIYATYRETITDLGNGMERVTPIMTDLRTGIETAGQSTDRAIAGYGDLTAELAKATGQTAPAATGISQVTGALDTNSIALGKNVQAWKNSALNEQLLGFFDQGQNKDLLKQLQAQFDPAVLDKVIKAGIEGGPTAIANYFKPLTDQMVIQMDNLQAEIDRKTQMIMASGARNGGGSAVAAKATADAKAQLDNLRAQYGLIAELQQKFAQADTAVEAAAIQGQIADALAKNLGIVENDLDDLNDVVKTQAELLQEASDQYSAYVDNLFGSADLAGNLANAFESLGESIADNGTDFSNMTDAGRANLAALSDVVAAFAATQDQAIKEGAISAEQAAVNTSQFIRDTMAELSNQGVDTSQLDFLNQYLINLTGQDYRITVNANTQGAINALLHVQQVAANTLGVLNRISGLNFSAAKIVGTGGKPPAAVAPKAVRSAVPTGQLNAGLASARAARETENLAKAQDKAGGAAKKAGKAGKDAGEAQEKAAKDAAEAIKKQQEYLRDLGNFYEGLASKAFKAIKAEGDSFKALQELGASLTENGKSFNTFTERGRKNMDALTSVFDSFGGTLSAQIERGAMSADQAAAKYREFARGVYGELQSLGVPTAELTGFFRALGVEATGWTGNTGDVQQYSGFISAAAEATAKLAEELDKADEYADKLAESLNKAFDRYYGLGSAVDDVQAAMNGLREAYQSNIDKVKELRQANQALAGDLSSAQADKRKAEIERDISNKYGETDRAQKYQADADVAGANVSEIQSKIAANQKEAQTLEAGRNALVGYSAAAIENRTALVDLQSQMLKQIEAYAATGASTEQVAAYTEQLRQEFVKAATDAGYTNTAIVGYTAAFDKYAAAVRAVPSTTSTVATADTSAATAALNAIPKSGTHSTVATLDGPNYEYVKWQLGLIPKKGDYVVNVSSTGSASVSPSVDGGALTGAQNTLNELTKPRTVKISPETPTGLIPGFSLYRSAVANLGGLIGHNKVTRGFANGGLVPGKAPRDPRVDNLLAKGPGGLFGIRSEEYVINQSAVRKFGVPFFDALNNGELPGYNTGGSMGSSSRGGMGVQMVELSPEDRGRLDRIAAAVGTTLVLDTGVIAGGTDRSFGRMAARGRS
jgi:hypothetical protein